MNKKKRMLIISIILIIIVGLCAITIPYAINKQKETKKIEEILKGQSCELVRITSSKEKGYEKDIVTKIKYKPIESNDSSYSNKYYYDQLIQDLSNSINNNFRIIDNENDLIIRVEVGKGYTINDDSNYFENELGKIQQEKTIIAKANNVSISSSILKGIIARKWSTEKFNLQEAEHSKLDNQDLYKFNGYELIVEGNKIINITFTKDYNEEVFSGVKTGLFNSQIKQALGEPLYNNMDAEVIIGYKFKDCYAFFYEGTISVYSYDNNNSEKLLEYEAKKDLGKYFGNNNNN